MPYEACTLVYERLVSNEACTHKLSSVKTAWRASTLSKKWCRRCACECEWPWRAFSGVHACDTSDLPEYYRERTAFNIMWVPRFVYLNVFLYYYYWAVKDLRMVRTSLAIHEKVNQLQRTNEGVMELVWIRVSWGKKNDGSSLFFSRKRQKDWHRMRQVG